MNICRTKEICDYVIGPVSPAGCQDKLCGHEAAGQWTQERVSGQYISFSLAWGQKNAICTSVLLEAVLQSHCLEETRVLKDNK